MHDLTLASIYKVANRLTLKVVSTLLEQTDVVSGPSYA